MSVTALRADRPPEVAGDSWSVVHDFSFVFGGAEWVTRVLSADVLPGCRTYLLAGNPAVAARLNPRGPVRSVTRMGRYSYRLATPAYPALVGSAPPLMGNVLASSYGFSHHVPATGAKVVYCHSPLRQAWTGTRDYATGGPLLERVGTRLLGGRLRAADRRAAATADGYIATSRAVRDRVEHCYGLSDVPIVPPPVNDAVYRRTDRARQDHYLFVGRITEPYKRLGVLIEAFRQMPGRRLRVIGDGRDRARLEASAPPNVQFLGWQGPEEIAAQLNAARCLVFPSEDDFGLVPVEAMSCGCPVLALARGGALDTVVPGVGGDFFPESSPAAIVRAVTAFERRSWDDAVVADSARRFSRAQFVSAMREVLGGVAHAVATRS